MRHHSTQIFYRTRVKDFFLKYIKRDVKCFGRYFWSAWSAEVFANLSKHKHVYLDTKAFFED